MSRNPILQAALDYTDRGWRVFPLQVGGKLPLLPATHPQGDPLRATCKGGCGRLGHGLHDATGDPVMVETWFSRRPTPNVGVACGASGLVVIDLDTGDSEPPARVLRQQAEDQATPEWVRDSRDVLRWLAECRQGSVDDLRRTYTVRTASGGLHLVYRAPAGVEVTSGAGMVSGLGWQVDVRAAGGYVVAPPSVRPGGSWRVVTNGIVSVLPGWLLDALAAAGRVPSRAPKPGRPAAPMPRLTDAGSTRRHRYLHAAVSRELQDVLDAQPGCRNVTLNRAAYSLGQLVAGAGLDETAVATELLLAATSIGLGEHEADQTIASGLRAGAASPRSAAG